MVKRKVVEVPEHLKIMDLRYNEHFEEDFVQPVARDVNVVLDERGAQYGLFADHATISQSLKSIMSACGNWQKLEDDQKESLEMVAHKIARILNGNPDHEDSWRDIAGYSTLVADRLLGVKR